jgi:hypothetical protein
MKWANGTFVPRELFQYFVHDEGLKEMPQDRLET